MLLSAQVLTRRDQLELKAHQAEDRKSKKDKTVEGDGQDDGAGEPKAKRAKAKAKAEGTEKSKCDDVQVPGDGWDAEYASDLESTKKALFKDGNGEDTLALPVPSVGGNKSAAEVLATYVPDSFAKNRPPKKEKSSTSSSLPADQKDGAPKAKAKAKPKAKAKGKARAKKDDAPPTPKAKAKGKQRKPRSPFIEAEQANRRRRSVPPVVPDAFAAVVDDMLQLSMARVMNEALKVPASDLEALKLVLQTALPNQYRLGKCSHYWTRKPNGGCGVLYYPDLQRIKDTQKHVTTFSYNVGKTYNINMTMAYVSGGFLVSWSQNVIKLP